MEGTDCITSALEASKVSMARTGPSHLRRHPYPPVLLVAVDGVWRASVLCRHPDVTPSVTSSPTRCYKPTARTEIRGDLLLVFADGRRERRPALSDAVLQVAARQSGGDTAADA